MNKIFGKLTDIFKNSRGAAWAAVLCAVAIVLIVCFFCYSAAYSKILPNVWVKDVNVGGMTIDEATIEIASTYKDFGAGRTLTLACDTSKKDITFDELEIRPDYKKTAEAAFQAGRTGGVFKKSFKLLSLAFTKEYIPLSITSDQKALDEVLKELSSGQEVAPTATSYTLSGSELTITHGHGGKMIDRQKALASLANAFSDPSVKKVNLSLETLKAKPTDLDSFYQELTSPVKNAAYRIEDGNVVIDAEKPAIIVDKSLVKAALESEKAETTLTVKTKAPNVTAKQLEELLFRDTLASYSSSFATSSSARASNVILTANRINGKILMPGDVFSYDTTIGKRTYANGYREAGVYIGNKVENGIGGGICQTSSTLYSAALYANLEIVSRTSHSLPVSYVPAGQDATIAEGYIDLKIKNNTDYPVKISAIVEGRKLTCSFHGVKDPEVTVEISHYTTETYTPVAERTENEEIPKGYIYVANKGANGYAVASQRTVKRNGKVEKTEKLTRSVYRAAPIEEQVNPADKDTPSDMLKPYTPGMEIPPEAVESPDNSPITQENPDITENNNPAESEQSNNESIGNELNSNESDNTNIETAE